MWFFATIWKVKRGLKSLPSLHLSSRALYKDTTSHAFPVQGIWPTARVDGAQLSRTSSCNGVRHKWTALGVDYAQARQPACSSTFTFWAYALTDTKSVLANHLNCLAADKNEDFRGNSPCLIAYVLKPGNYHIHGGALKWILVPAHSDKLPHIILNVFRSLRTEALGSSPGIVICKCKAALQSKALRKHRFHRYRPKTSFWWPSRHYGTTCLPCQLSLVIHTAFWPTHACLPRAVSYLTITWLVMDNIKFNCNAHR